MVKYELLNYLDVFLFMQYVYEYIFLFQLSVPELIKNF